MQLTSNSHISFNIYIDGRISHTNENIFFTCAYIKKWQCPDFIKQLEEMEVCTKMYFENGLSIFKN